MAALVSAGGLCLLDASSLAGEKPPRNPSEAPGAVWALVLPCSAAVGHRFLLLPSIRNLFCELSTDLASQTDLVCVLSWIFKSTLGMRSRLVLQQQGSNRRTLCWGSKNLCPRPPPRRSSAIAGVFQTLRSYGWAAPERSPCGRAQRAVG